MEAKTILQYYFDHFYAEEIRSKMHPVFKDKCVGCQHAMLSQSEHTCLSLPTKILLKLYFEDVLKNVNEQNVLKN